MQKPLLLLTCMVVLILSGCAARVKTVSPPPYPPPAPTASPSPYPAPSDTVWPSPSPQLLSTATLMGTVTLQGRGTYEGITVTVGDLPPLITGEDGTFVIPGVPLGQHAIRVERAGYLSGESVVALASVGETKLLPTATMLAGDVNGDAAIDLFDLVTVSTAFGADAAAGLVADLNDDGSVNLADLVLVGLNLFQSGPIALEFL